MEQGNGDGAVLDCVVVRSREEREVADTLLDMCDLMLEMDSDLKIPYQWGRKRKRSVIRACSTRVVLPPSYSPKPALRNSNGGCPDGGGDAGGVVVAAAAAKVKAKVKSEASSPATPLSLSLTESDEKPNDKPLRTKASLKRKKEYYLNSLEDMNERNAKLNQELEKVICYYEEQKAYNLKLKQRKQELINGFRREHKKNPISEIGSQMHQELVKPFTCMPQNENQKHKNDDHQELQVPNTTQIIRLRINQNSGQPSNPSISSPSAPLTMVNNPTSFSSSNIPPPLGGGVIDLNVSPEELVHVEPYQPLDVNRVMSAQARQRRIQINRLKNNPISNNNNNNNNKSRYSCRA